jgi:hypothetical protein
MKQTHFLFAFFLVLGFPGKSLANESTSTLEELRYNGSFLGPHVEGGLSIPLPGSDLEGLGWQVGASMRMATILQILDFSGSYYFHQSHLSGHKHQEHSLTLELRFHPLLFMHLFQKRTSYTLATIHSLVFVGPMMASSKEIGRDYTPVYGFGLGIDIPLTMLNRERAWWLGINWRLRFAEIEAKDLGAQSLNLNLSYRFHGL